MKTELSPEHKEDIYIASGFAHPELAAGIAEEVGVELGPVEYRLHPNGEIYTRFEESVRGKHVFVVQPHTGTGRYGENIHTAIAQVNLLADAARSSSAREVTAINPYIAYTRSDRKARGREPIGIRMIIDHMAASGVDRLMSVDMHAPQSQGIFRGPFDHLTAQPVLRKAMREEISGYEPGEAIVVAPDLGAVKLADRHRTALNIGMVTMAKFRDPNEPQKIRREERIPEADGKVCVMFDDMIDTAGTLVTGVEVLKDSGAKAVYVAATHGVFSEQALERLQDAPVERVLVTDTLPMHAAKAALGDKLRVVSMAPTIGQAVVQIMNNGSISDIFQDQNHM